MPQPFIVGVSGGTSSGKSSICKELYDSIGEKYCVVLRLDCFVKEFSDPSKYSHDHPEAIDFENLRKTLEDLKNSHSVSIPRHTCDDSYFCETLPAKIILLEGNMILYNKEVRDFIDLKLYVHTDDDERLSRKILLETCDKHSNIVDIIQRYRLVDKPAFENYIAPTIRYADVIIPRGRESKPALNIIKDFLQKKVESF